LEAKAALRSIVRCDTGESFRETVVQAAEHVEAVRPEGDGIQEVVGDEGYHSNQSILDFEAVGVHSYISEPFRGRRNWTTNLKARAAVYRNRRRHSRRPRPTPAAAARRAATETARSGLPEDVGRCIAALCHPATYWLSDNTIHVDGGENIVG